MLNEAAVDANPLVYDLVVDFSKNYQVAKLIENTKLFYEIQDIKKKKQDEIDSNKHSILEYFSSFIITSAAFHNSTVDEYWSDSKNKIKGGNAAEKKTANQIQEQILLNFDAKILQLAFRLWAKLERMRRERKVANSAKDKIIMVQTSARRWLARKLIYELDKERKEEDRKFQKFCLLLYNGVQISMFSKKYGDLQKRELRFDIDEDGAYLVFQRSYWSIAKYNLNLIYEVEKGISDFPYASKEAAQTASCLHLKMLGGDILDIMCKDGVQARELHAGFTRVRLLMYTQAPFYTDLAGFPRRAGPSVIEFALQSAQSAHNLLPSQQQLQGSENETQDSGSAYTNVDEQKLEKNNNKKLKRKDKDLIQTHPERTALSEADHVRYRSALRVLKEEYSAWDATYAREKLRFEHTRDAKEKKRRERAERIESTEQGTTETMPKKTTKKKKHRKKSKANSDEEEHKDEEEEEEEEFIQIQVPPTVLQKERSRTGLYFPSSSESMQAFHRSNLSMDELKNAIASMRSRIDVDHALEGLYDLEEGEDEEEHEEGKGADDRIDKCDIEDIGVVV